MDGLKRHVASQLSSHKVPASIVAVHSLPRDANGKVSRRSAAQAATSAIESKGGAAPSGPIETWLVDVFRDLLNGEPVFADSDFFELGGSSLDVVELQLRLEEALSVTVHMPFLLDTPVVRDLARTLTDVYPNAVARLTGEEPDSEGHAATATASDAMHRDFAISLPARNLAHTKPIKVSPVFVLSAPRCGSTLLRVMLAGHPDIFSPPELRLLSFTDMLWVRKRRDAIAGADIDNQGGGDSTSTPAHPQLARCPRSYVRSDRGQKHRRRGHSSVLVFPGRA